MMLSTNDIRLRFLNFFKSKGHTIVRSDSLVPKDDPTVLFTTAGMQQFKPQFLGRDLTYTRASTSQKCLRTDDLDVVGKTDFHHTFFEMLGNFSFGDYFKKEAIAWAWEFLTGELKLPKDRLWVSVYKDDDEAYNIWLNDIKIPSNRIVKLGDKSNFWPSNARVNGPNGPCGPCSEIFFDYGINAQCPNGDQCNPDCSCGRFSEVWNLVFTQFNRKDGGVLDPLPAKNIDTGMGLERLAAVVQGKKSNYQTDIFEPILTQVKKTIVGINERDSRIIADHMRAIIFAINDGVVPSNEGRGYVVRKLIIILADIAARMNFTMPVIYTFVDVVVAQMKFTYPEIEGRVKEIKEIIKRLEEQYLRLKTEKVPELLKKITETRDIEKLADIGFFYRDTYGLSMGLIMEVLSQAKVSNDAIDVVVKGVEQRLDHQRERSRASSKMTGDVFTDAGIDLNVPKTVFVGYDVLECVAQVERIVQQGSGVKIILDKTPFYAQSGGQVGDTGFIRNDNAVILITDTQKINDIYIHEGVLEQGVLKPGHHVTAQVDGLRREAIKSNHSATHLLQSALRQTLGAHVKQQGSLVQPSRLRFDFTHPLAVKKEEIVLLENIVNGYIKKADKVDIEVLPLEEAKKRGALAFFAEKYGDTVRVVSIGDYSREFCGGTHVNNTKDIDVIKIVSEGSVAQGIRRIEAVTGKKAVAEILEQEKEQSAQKAQAEKAKEDQIKQQKAQFETIKASIDSYIAKALMVNGIKVIIFMGKDLDVATLRKLSDIFKQKVPSGIFLLAYKSAHDAALIVAVSDDLVGKGLKANDMLSKVIPLFEGQGGGKPQLAQAGSKNPAKLDAAIEAVKELIKI